MKKTIGIIISVTSLAIVCSQKQAIACQVRNPRGWDLIECNNSSLKVELDRPFILKKGQNAKLYTKIAKALVEGVELSIEDSNIGGGKEKIWAIAVHKFQEYPHKYSNKCRSNILISRSQDYTINPVTRQGRRSGHRVILGCESAMSLELLDLTASGEAKIILKKRNSD